MKRVRVLNEGPVPETVADPEIAGRLRSDLQRLKADFLDPQRGRIDYSGLHRSEAYLRFVGDMLLLQAFAPQRLENREEKLAFWINLYNALVIHGVIELGIRESVREEPHFFRAISYRVGDLLFTPDDIEHGILRGNRRHPHGLFEPLSASDPRHALIIDPPDSRIHFTLFCASASCPSINFYTPERIEMQLDLAAAGFVNGPEVQILPSENLLRLSPIFKWYRVDFGGHDGVIDTLIRYLDHGEAKDFLLERGMGADVEYEEYNWRLNR